MEKTDEVRRCKGVKARDSREAVYLRCKAPRMKDTGMGTARGSKAKLSAGQFAKTPGASRDIRRAWGSELPGVSRASPPARWSTPRWGL